MTELKTDLESSAELQRDIYEHLRNDFFQDKIVTAKQLEKIFKNGIKEGSVIFVPRRDGTGILNVNAVVAGEKVSKNLEIEDEDQSAFLLGLQSSINTSKE